MDTKKEKDVAFMISDSGAITVVVDGQPHSIATDHINYDAIIECLKSMDYDALDGLLDVGKAIREASAGKVSVINGAVFYDGREIVNALTDRILRFVKEDLPFEPMVKFLDNLLGNPSRTAIQELYLFLENNELPITADGHLLAYRKVDNEYMSFHANPDGTKNRNKVGDVVEMTRNEVDDCRERTCSQGLHFASLSYMPCYWGGNGRVMVVKINPADVVSIPSDYNNAKGRTCKYEVIAEHTNPEKEYKEYTSAALTAADGSEYQEDEEYCPDCDCALEDGVCPLCDICPTCGEFNDDCCCEVDEDDTPPCNGSGHCSPACGCGSTVLGTKPDGSKFHNVRDNKGRFTRK